KEQRKGDRRRGERIEVVKREQPERQERPEQQDIAKRQIDDAHDAEHEVEPETDQGEIQAEQEAGEQRVGQHAFSPPPGGGGRRAAKRRTGWGCTPPRALRARPSPSRGGWESRRSRA